MSEANEALISSHIWGRLDDIQTALKPFKKSEKKWEERKFMAILVLAESFNDMVDLSW